MILVKLKNCKPFECEDSKQPLYERLGAEIEHIATYKVIETKPIKKTKK